MFSIRRPYSATIRLAVVSSKIQLRPQIHFKSCVVKTLIQKVGGVCFYPHVSTSIVLFSLFRLLLYKIHMLYLGMKEVQDILNAEKQAELVLAKSHKDAEKILAKARQEALDLLTSEKVKIDRHAEEEVAKKSTELERKSESILEEGAKRMRKLEAAAAKKTVKAQKILIDAVVGE